MEKVSLKLWGGYSRIAEPKLVKIAGSDPSLAVRQFALWHLAGWQFCAGQYNLALKHIKAHKKLGGPPDRQIALLESRSLIRLRQYSLAIKRIRQAIHNFGPLIDLYLLLGTARKHEALSQGVSPAKADALLLASINQACKLGGHSPLILRDPSRPLHISNLSTPPLPRSPHRLIKISVIIPAYNSAATLETAVCSLLAQTHSNLEIIVVDDCSTDMTVEIAKHLAAVDPRVKVVSKNRNEGAYAARNDGLDHVTGTYIMVHDSDDWSHPQKLELQLSTLLKKRQAVGVMSNWVRVTETLDAVGAWRPKATILDKNFSSLLFRTDVLTKAGSWDNVRVSADAEFRNRLRAIYGQTAICETKNAILSLSLYRDDSLTQTKATHVRTLDFGLRWQYADAYRQWHKTLTRESKVSPIDKRMPFPAPLGNRTFSLRGASYDFVFISDFAMQGGALISTLNYVEAAAALGLRLAILHWRNAEHTPGSPLDHRVYRLCLEHHIDILTHGDSVSTRHTLIGYPVILQTLPDNLPRIATEHLIVVVNQCAERHHTGKEPQYDPLVVRKNLMDIFGQEGHWIPISPWVKSIMRADPRYPVPHDACWYPLINLVTWCDQSLRWRGDSRTRPVIGRHGRDTATKWPSDPDALRQAYLTGESVDVHLLGGAKYALRKIKKLPENWHVHEFNSISTKEFLQGLDFYIHYTHETYIEEFGRAVMEAMAVGIPVILPPRFEITFGAAAIYAEPSEVKSKLFVYWGNRDQYISQAEAGRSFVRRHCDSTLFSQRLQSLITGSPAFLKSSIPIIPFRSQLAPPQSKTHDKIDAISLKDIPRLRISSLSELPETLQLTRYEYHCEGERHDFIFHPGNDDRLFVLLSGYADRTKLTPPVFQRWSWASRFPGHCLYIADPTLHRSRNLAIAWYAGDSSTDLRPGLLAIIHAVIARLGLSVSDVILYGSSGGGFAALKLAAGLPESTVVAINPQIDVTLYHGRQADTYLAECFGGLSREEASNLHPSRLSVLPDCSVLSKQRIVYAQNISDRHHLTTHFPLWASALGLNPDNAFCRDQLHTLFFEHPEGHAKGESPEVFTRILELIQTFRQ